MSLQRFRRGDWVEFREYRWDTHPQPQAQDVRPETAGEGYRYCIRHVGWVGDTRDDAVQLLTVDGQTRWVSQTDPHISRAGWLRRLALPLLYRTAPRSPLPT